MTGNPRVREKAPETYRRAWDSLQYYLKSRHEPGRTPGTEQFRPSRCLAYECLATLRGLEALYGRDFVRSEVQA
jgi:hypothetical protein